MFEVPHQGGDRRGILLCDSSVKQGQKKKKKSNTPMVGRRTAVRGCVQARAGDVIWSPQKYILGNVERWGGSRSRGIGSLIRHHLNVHQVRQEGVDVWLASENLWPLRWALRLLVLFFSPWTLLHLSIWRVSWQIRSPFLQVRWIFTFFGAVEVGLQMWA